MKRFILFLLLCNSIFYVTAQNQTITFSHDAGFYDSPFTLVMQTSPGLEIVYTLDGSNPRTSQKSYTISSTGSVYIDPDDSTARAATPCVIVRASVKIGDSVYHPASKTYIFTNKVKYQKSPGGNWPAEAYNGVNNHNIDYSMDTAVVNSPTYSGQIDEALSSIPVYSIAVDVKDLFDPKTGIYVNSYSTGDEWERDCSFELIDPKLNIQKFQVNAGLRIKGDWSKQNFNPKYSLRILFREKYGMEELKYPLFDSEGDSTFSTIDLRTEQNCNWTLDGTTLKHNTFLRDIFARDCQRDMNWPHIRSRYCHLYLNGMYWGLYMTHEKVDKDYAKTYFDGTKDEYDVIKDAEVSDGTGESWKALWTITKDGYTDNERYFFLEGKTKEGYPALGGQTLCDIDNLIDYMLVVFYTGNFDGPVSKWGSNNSAANFIALKDKGDRSMGFKFFAVDFEYSMFTEPVHIGDGLEENRVDIGFNTTDGVVMSTTDYANFNPQWLHHKLSYNAEYKTRFIDRAYKHFKGNGALSPNSNLVRMAKRKAQIESAIIAESARWGDAQVDSGETSMTKQDWLTEVATLENIFFPKRTDIVIGQLKEVGLFSNITAPEISVSNKNVSDIYWLNGTETVNITNSNSSGSIYYTENGKDPRLIGGNAAGYAKISNSTVSISASKSMIIKARIKSGDEWGPLTSVKIMVKTTQEDYSKLKVTELNYHPNNEYVDTGTIDGDDFEFIELKNIGTVALNISGIKIDSAIKYEVPANTILAPGEYYVVASKPNKFYYRYSMTASGNFSKSLGNSAEFILIEDSMKNKILSFTYSDTYPWPKLADGGGYTLVSLDKDPTGDPNDYRYWTLSNAIGGNPFSDTVLTRPKVFTELQEFAAKFMIYPNPVRDILKVESGSENIESTFALYDMFGKLITRKQFYGQTSVNMRSLNVRSGFYIATVTNSQGTKTEKIIFK